MGDYSPLGRRQIRAWIIDSSAIQIRSSRAVLIIVGRDWIAVSAASRAGASSITNAAPGTFLVGGYRFRRRLSPYARKLGRNSKNAARSVLTAAIYHGSHARNSNTRSIPRYRRGAMGGERRIVWYNGRGTCARSRGESKLCDHRVNCLVSSAVASRYCGTWLREFRSLTNIVRDAGHDL